MKVRSKSHGIEWAPVGRISKRDIKLAGPGPIESLHLKAKQLMPSARSVSDIGYSQATDDYFKSQIEKYVLRDHPYLDRKSRQLESTIAMAMLQYGFVVIDGATPDFVLFERVQP